jgi:glycosyltransferase involved in cell wall biosynthesis
MSIRVLFAPDYRAGTPYQTLLAEALTRHDIEVVFLTNYRRGLPLYRGSRGFAPDIVHVHWPEKYFERRGDGWDWLRVMRYPLDCRLSANRTPLILTAHNFLPHNRTDECGVLRNLKYTVQHSKGIFVHSEAARRAIIDQCSVRGERVHVIPFGDHSVILGKPQPRDAARVALQLPVEAKVCLVFGTISPYKGSEELVRFWAQTRVPHYLVIVGPILNHEHAQVLTTLAQDCPSVDLRFSREWLDHETLGAWLSASDCVIFNYREIFTSGAAALARSFGIPLLIPHRLTFADLQEPHTHVFRFHALDDDFRAQLEHALVTGTNYEAGRDWRNATSWERVAEITAPVYRDTVKHCAISEFATAELDHLSP